MQKFIEIKLVLIVCIFISTCSFAQKTDFIPRRKVLKLESKIDSDNYVDCNNEKKVNKFKTLLNEQETLYFLKNGSPSIRIITTEIFFSVTHENTLEILEIFRNYKNELIYQCNYVGHDYLINYILFRVESKKDNNIEVYNLLLSNGEIAPTSE